MKNIKKTSYSVLALFLFATQKNVWSVPLLDDFNDGSKSSWTTQAGTISEGGGALSGSYRSLATYDRVSSKVIGVDAETGNDSVSYVALVLNYNDINDNLFVKLQDNNNNQLFDKIYFYHGNNNSSSSALVGPNNFNLAFETGNTYFQLTDNNDGTVSAYIEATGDLFVGTLDNSYTGTGVGLGFYGRAKADNFYAPPPPPLPPPKPKPAPTTLLPGTLGYLHLYAPQTKWQHTVWQSNPTSSKVLWSDGCDAMFIGSGSTYSVTLGSPVTVRDIGLTGGRLSLASSNARLTFTDPRDGYPTIEVSSGSSLSFDTPVTATGGLVRTGAGDVTFNSPLSVNNSLMLASGATVINNSASIGGTTTVDSSLTVNGTMSTGTLAVTSLGSTRINGSLSARSTDNYGFLNVNGTLDSPVTNRGFLGGSGQINGSVYNYRLISPGNSIGTLTINGSYTHGSGATFIAEIDKNGSSDLLNVAGSASINGGTVSTSLPRALYPDGYSWNFLQASGGINGQFANIYGQPNSSTLNLSLDYTVTQASIKLNRKSYASFSTNKGAQSIGNALDSYVPLARNTGDDMESLLIAMDFDYSPTGISNLLSELNPEIYPTFLAVEQQAAVRFSGSISQRASQVRELNKFNMENSLEKAEVVVPKANGGELNIRSSDPSWLVWGKAQGESLFKDTTSDYNGYDFRTGGGIVGADTQISETVRIGMATAFETTDIEWKQGADGNQDNIMFGLYAEGQYDGFYADTQGSIGFYDNQASRSVFSTLRNVDFDGKSYMFNLGGGYDFQYENCIIGPLASLSYIHARTSDFSENGYLALNVDDSSEDILLSYIGFHAASKVIVGETNIAARFELGWQHDFHGDKFEMNGRFDNYPVFSFSGPGLDEDMLIASAETTVTLGEQLSAYVEIGGAVGSNTKGYNVSIGLQWLF